MRILFLGGDLVMGTYWPRRQHPSCTSKKVLYENSNKNSMLLEGVSAKVAKPVDLAKWLVNQNEDVIYTENKISAKFCKNAKCDLVICYNYRYLLPKHIINVFEGNCINLHISFLPWNKGYHPYIWNFLESTPNGVTVHKIDKGIDTGDIIIQKEVTINQDQETIKSVYEILHTEIQRLFKSNWLKISRNEFIPTKQSGGNHHYRYEFTKFEPFLRKKGWETIISDFRNEYLQSNL